MSAFLQDVRYAARLLAKKPGFTASAVACLALGIGATTAIFSVVNAVLLRPLPYAQSGRLVRVFTEFPTFPNGGLRHFWVSPPEFFDLRRDTQSFSEIGGWTNQGVNLAGASDPIRATASATAGPMLPMLGVQPLLGRLYGAEEDKPNVGLTAVLSFGLWQRAFGGDRGVVGRDIRLNGNACTVVGVMPPGFAFPPGELDPPELWVPLQLDPAATNRGSHFLNLVGRLRDGVSLQQAESEMDRYEQISNEKLGANNHRFNDKNHPIVLAGFQDEVVKGVRRAMLVLLGAVVFVLLIACVNVANLLLARSEARRREIAIRTAIGAGWRSLLQQFVVEGVLLSLAGAAFGMLFAFAGLRLLVATNAGSIPRIAEIGIDWQVLLFTLAVSIATGIVFGLAPIMHMRPSTLHDTLKAAAGRSSAAAGAQRFRAVLVSAELALALVLLIGSGLMVKAFWKLQEVNVGIDTSNILSMRLALPQANYRDAAAVGNFYKSLTDRVNALPGVVSAALISGLPPERPVNANDTPIEGFVPRPGGPIQNIDYWNNVSPKFFETVGARLIEGRFLNEGDGPNAPPVLVVNQTLAKIYWPNESAIGHRMRTSFGPTAPWSTIVGVIADIKNGGLDKTTGTELYRSAWQSPARTTYLFVKTKGSPTALANAVRSEIRQLDRALPIAELRTLDEVMGKAQSRPRFLTLLLTIFSVLSLILAALGIYGVISYSVAQRTNEIGIRMALGAQSGDVLKLVGRMGVTLALAGAVVGAVGAFALTKTMSGLLFGVSTFDIGTFLAMAALLVGVAMIACYIPARRAAKVDPLIALRYE
jgi:putative ABC transport system permease protein